MPVVADEAEPVVGGCDASDILKALHTDRRAPVVASLQTRRNMSLGCDVSKELRPSGPLNQYWKVMRSIGMTTPPATLAILQASQTAFVTEDAPQKAATRKANDGIELLKLRFDFDQEY
jgi:hypothetical protein